jgi:type I restriction-modification system DNA methylase subunit
MAQAAQLDHPLVGQGVQLLNVGVEGKLLLLADEQEQARPAGATGRTFTGKEKKSLAYVIAIMNMILHGIEAPKVLHTNTLTENLSDVQERDRFDVILANPPFGGSERKEVQQNFEIRSGETAFLFLQHFIRLLRAGGRAGVVIKNTFLSNTDNASVALRQKLLTDCNLHTVLDCPGGTFQGAGVKTVVLFFEKGSAHPQGVVLPARSRTQPGQDQPAQRPRPGGVCGAAEILCRFAQELECGGGLD